MLMSTPQVFEQSLFLFVIVSAQFATNFAKKIWAALLLSGILNFG